MDLIFHPVFKGHDTGMHPENRKRLDVFGNLKVTDIDYDENLLKIIHGDAYIDKVKQYCQNSMFLDNDTRTSPDSYQVAVYATNATVLASASNDFAMVRPPGHHAYPDHSSGFCIFNHVAIAVQNLVNQGKRVLIFDFDGHLGDGTSEIFYGSDKVMYWSIHQYPAFPGHGTEDETGKDKGAGFTINVPMPPMSGDDIFWDAFRTTLPIAKQFNPDVVALSAGFDAHRYDLLLDLQLTVDTYYMLGKIVRENFNDVFATLEGGYNIEELPRCLYNFLDGFNEKPKQYSEKPTETNIKIWGVYEIRVDKLLSNLRPYWEI